MTNEQSRDIVVSLALIIAIPTQIAAMFTQDSRGILDWIVLGALLLWGWVHVEMGREKLTRDRAE